jgi:hypothetical protein
MQPVQSFSLEALLLFCYKQLALADEVYVVYEAGPLGYVLYRRLTEIGLKAYVCAPEGSVADRCIHHAASTLYHTCKGSVPKLSGRPNWPLMIL